MATEHQLTRLGKVLIASESAYNTDALDGNLGAANDYTYQAFRTCDILPVDAIVEHQRVTCSFDGVPSSVLKNHVSVSIEGPLHGAILSGGPATEAPHYAPLLQAAGMSETIVASTSATYAPSTTQQDAMTIYRYLRNAEDGNFRMIYATGVRGNMVLNFAVGDEITYQFDGIGANFPESTDTAGFNGWSADLAFVDANGLIVLDKTGAAFVATSGTVGYDTRRKLMVEAITVEAGGVTYPCAGLTFSPNYTVSALQTINSAQQTSRVILTRDPGNRPGGTLQLLETDDAYEATIAAWLSAGEVTLNVVASNGSGAGFDRFTLASANMQFFLPTPSDSGGVTAWSVDYRLSGAYTTPIGNDSFSMAYDQAP